MTKANPQPTAPHNVAPFTDVTEAMSGERLRLLYIPLDQAALWDENPKEHELHLIAASIRKHGFRDPMAYDGTLEAFIEGHGRTHALRWIRNQGEEPPRGIGLHPDLGWCIPVLFGIDAKSLEAAKAYAVGHNQLTISGGFDSHKLQAVMRAVVDSGDAEALETAGFDGRRLRALLGDRDDLDATPGQAVSSGADDPTLTISPELFERHDYLLFYFDNAFDWQVACEALGVEQVVGGLVKQKTLRQRGLGRVIPGRKLVELLTHD